MDKKPEMSPCDKHLARMKNRHSHEIEGVERHRAEIDRFSLAIAPFGLLNSITVLSLGGIYLSAVIPYSKNHASVMLALIQAGYEIGVSEKVSTVLCTTSWKAPVTGNGLEFSLVFDIPSD